MAFVIKDRVKETTTTTGTGTLTLAGALNGFDAFSEIGDGNNTYYACADGTDFEVGIGTYTLSGTTLSRDTVLESSSTKITADVDGAVSASASVTVDNVQGGTLTVGQRVRGTGISGIVTIAGVASQTSITLSTAVTLADDTALTIGDEKINWTAGTRTVFCTMPSEKMVYNDASGNAVNLVEQDPNALAFAIALG
jgi:DNA-binding cell septation regulator SpoVG